MQTSTDVQRRGKEFFASWSPVPKHHRLTESQLDLLVAVADVMIPTDEAWVAPSSTEIRAYIDRGARRESDVRLLSLVADSIAAIAGADAASIANELERVQKASPTAFRCLQEFVYYGYYAQPEVVRAIRDELDCDYISPPQPRGYDMPFDTDICPNVTRTYRSTQDIRRLDIEHLDFAEKDHP